MRFLNYEEELVARELDLTEKFTARLDERYKQKFRQVEICSIRAFGFLNDPYPSV